MNRRLVSILAALCSAAATAGIATATDGGGHGHGDEQGARGYAIGLWGDMPYNTLQKTTGVPNLIADMNSQKLRFTVHDGDIKAGAATSLCTDDVYTDFKGFLNSLRAPAMYTPGDNEWTDCDRNPSYTSAERLDFDRRVFFQTPYSLGQRKLRQDVQAPPYVENRRWQAGRVTYATLNVPGSCNNLCDTAPSPAEYAARNAADIQWLHQTFQSAKENGSAAVMLVFQANPGWDASDGTRAPTRNPKTLVETDADPDGFHDFLVALRDETTAFRKPVAAVHGDSHYFRVDKPLQDSQGRRLENFTRVETFGDHQENGLNDVHWLKVLVDPRSRDVFSFQPQIVPGNRTAVPAP